MSSSDRSGWLRARRWLRRLCLASGAALLAFVGVARLHSELGSRAGLEELRQVRAAAADASVSSASAPDRSLWADTRVEAWQASLAAELGAPLAVLRIPRLALEVPVWNGLDELTLNRGLGRIPGTARIGELGNLGIAGHRDGFFRALKDIAIGDQIELETLAGVERFAVESTQVVEQEDVSVLAPTPEPSLTLVTCYPFYFVGKAPQRFIVRAAVRRVEAAHAEASP